MEDTNDNNLVQIQELRAEAGKTLHGNEYFAVAHMLDALLVNGNRGSADAQAELQALRSRFFSDAPETDEPAMTGGADKAVLEEIAALRAELAGTLQGNDYFAVAQKLDALVAGGNLSSPDVQETIQTIRSRLISGAEQVTEDPQNEIPEDIVALRESAGKKLHGNDYFNAAQKLDALIAAGDSNAAPASEALEQIRSIIENGQEAAATADQSPSAAEQVSEPDINAATTIVFPKANSFSAPQPTVAVKLAANKDDEAGAPDADADAGPEAALETTSVSEDDMTIEADAALENTEASAEVAPPDMAIEEKNGFDVLAEASWRRVCEVSATVETVADEAEETHMPTEETAPAPETTPAEEQSVFRIIPRPAIMNRPVKKERFVRLKRLAKLAHIPIRKD